MRRGNTFGRKARRGTAGCEEAGLRKSLRALRSGALRTYLERQNSSMSIANRHARHIGILPPHFQSIKKMRTLWIMSSPFNEMQSRNNANHFPPYSAPFSYCFTVFPLPFLS
jgi:hypothetical protein